MKKIIGCITLVAILISGCETNSSSKSSEEKQPAQTRELLVSDVQSLEQKISSQQTIDLSLAKSIVTAYTNFSASFPADSLAPDYLFKAGDISMNVKQGANAIELFKKITDNYPNYKKVSFALFLQGFVYETQLSDTANAKRIYKQVIEKYPSSKIATDASASIANLGKSDEQLIKEFEKKNKAK